jgi:dihydroxyacetone kinase
LQLAVEKAIEGALQTRGMIPRLGRAAYVTLGKQSDGVIDPGAWGVAKLLEGFAEGWLGAVPEEGGAGDKETMKLSRN